MHSDGIYLLTGGDDGSDNQRKYPGIGPGKRLRHFQH